MDVQNINYTSANARAQLAESFRNTGFAVLTHHPLSNDMIQEIYERWGDFFKNADKEKYLFSRQDEVQAGFFPMNTETAKGKKIPDLKEFYHFYPWGKAPEDLKTLTQTLYSELNNIGSTLLAWLESETPASISEKFSMPLTKMVQDSKNTLLRILHYPPLQGTEAPGAIRAAAHEDINFITLLPAATETGLQVQDIHGNWHDVSCDAGSIAINVGDMLQECTNGYYPSTTHRVLNPVGENARKSRYSTPLFVHAHSEVRLSERYTMREYFRERLREIGLY